MSRRGRHGNGPAASALKKAPANLTLLAKKNNGKFPALEVDNYIRGDATSVAAHGTRDMPMWGDIFRGVSAGNDVVTLRVRTSATTLRECRRSRAGVDVEKSLDSWSRFPAQNSV